MPLEIRQDTATGLPTLPWPWRLGGSCELAWQEWALAVQAHWQAQGVEVADAVVLLPQIALLNVARQAWAQAVGGWMPRFETVGTLLDRLPQAEAKAGPTGSGYPPLTLDACIDGLLVTARLRGQESGRQWARRDPGGFEFAATRMMELAQQWLKAALSLRPAARERMVEQAECWLTEALQSSAGQDEPRARERVLTAMALSWAMEALPSLAGRRDPVFAHRPSAWVAVTLGGSVVPGSESCLMVSVLQDAMSQGHAVLWSQAQLGVVPEPGQLLAEGPMLAQARPTMALCSDGEDEALQTAAHVLALLARQRQAQTDDAAPARPLALIAMDRVVTRRVRALLAPMESAGQLLIHDESGWTLSTTRAATVVTRALVAAAPRATTDDVLDWLSSAWVQPPGGASAIAALERTWRVSGRMVPWQALDAPQGGQAHQDAVALQAWARQVLAPMSTWAAGKAAPLSEALLALRAVLQASGALQALADDGAGQAVLAALRLSEDAANTDDQSDALWMHLAATTRVNWSEWTRWVDQTLEGSTFMPEAAGKVPDVVIAPLSRAVLRPFGAVVLPGADDAMLGASTGDGWLSLADALALGLPSATIQQQAQWEAFSVLAAQGPMLALQRHLRDGEPVGPSPWLSRWSLAAGWPLGHDMWPQTPSQLLAHEVRCAAPDLPMPHLEPQASPAQAPSDLRSGEPARSPAGDALWPEQVSASSYERLRECPYRYFALGLLGLKSLDELEEGVDRQDQGIWLHAVLKRFHEGRPPELAPSTLEADVSRWLAVAQDVAVEHGLSHEGMRAHFLPYQITLPSLAEHYVRWLREQEQQGWAVSNMEVSLQTELTLFGDDTGQASALNLRLHGQLDRVDRRQSAEGPQAWVMDYKSGALQTLKKKVSHTQEDTQLAFYALLTSAQPGAVASLQASYLHIDDKACTDLPHEDVAASASQLADGMRHDFERIWLGHGLPALGEGSVCEFCDARGLCRKDHWPPGDVAKDAPTPGVASEVQA